MVDSMGVPSATCLLHIWDVVHYISVSLTSHDQCIG